MTPRLRGQRRDHIQIGSVAWRAAMWLSRARIRDDGLMIEVETLPLPSSMVSVTRVWL